MRKSFVMMFASIGCLIGLFLLTVIISLIGGVTFDQAFATTSYLLIPVCVFFLLFTALSIRSIFRNK